MTNKSPLHVHNYVSTPCLNNYYMMNEDCLRGITKSSRFNKIKY